jgi:hypothetical protein
MDTMAVIYFFPLSFSTQWSLATCKLYNTDKPPGLSLENTNCVTEYLTLRT